MDQPTRPTDPTQPAPPPEAWPPAAPAGTPAPQPAPNPAAWPPVPQGGQPAPSWAAPPEPLGPAPGLLFAPHGARLLAYIVDAIVVSLLATAVAILFGFLAAALAVAGADGLAVLSGAFIVVALFALSLGYFPWFWANGGATPGMRIFGLRVVRDRDGGPLGWSEAFLRLVGFWVSSFVFYLGFVWILVDRRRRGWHDLIAGTVMVKPA